MNVETLIHAKWIIPVEPFDQTFEHHSIAIDKGKIISILPTARARTEMSAQHELSLDQHALIPGLINAHTHAAMTLFRGLADDLPLMQWLNDHIWPAERKWISPEFISDGTRLGVAEMLRNGTTCFNDMYFYPDYTAEVASQLGIRSMIGLIMIDFPTAWAKDAEEYLAKGEQVYDKFKQHPLVNMAFAPHAPYTVSDTPLQRIATLADELDIPVHMHVHETKDEINHSLEKYKQRPLQRLYEMGLISERLIAVHMTQLEQHEIDMLAQQGVHVAHCPESNLKLASGTCPVKQLSDAGVNICIGTDGAASNNDLDMLGEIRTAALLAKGHSGDSTAINARTALAMGTINAAKALGLDKNIGSLLEGKEADIVAIDLAYIETQPVYDPVSQIIYSANRNQVSDVWIAGKHLLKNGELTQLDTNNLLEKTAKWRDRIISS